MMGLMNTLENTVADPSHFYHENLRAVLKTEKELIKDESKPQMFPTKLLVSKGI